jgi:integrase
MGLKREGARDRRHVSGTRRVDVVAKVRDLERQRDSSVAQEAGRVPTVADWLEHWLDTIAARKVRPRTLEGYRSKLRLHVVPALGHHRLDRLQPEHVEAFYAECERSGMAPASTLQCHRILSRALKVAMQRGKLARNVCTLVDAPSLVRSEVQPLTASEARRLLDAALDTRNAARWSVALSLGLRQGEALGLRWSDLDLDAGTLTVRRALQRQRDKGLVFVEPKSRAGRRTIVLPRPLREALRTHRAAQAEERLAAGSLWHDHDLLFAQVNGKPVEPRRDWQVWKELLTRAGVRDARLHDARHTAATLLMQQGVPARVAMQILGHSQISLTLGTYSHVVPELAEDAAERMGQALWGEVQ